MFDSQQNVYIVYGDAVLGTSFIVTANSGNRIFSLPTSVFTGLQNFSPDTNAAIDASDTIYLVANFGFSTVLLSSLDRARNFSFPQVIPSSFGIGSSIVATGRGRITVSWTDFEGSDLRIATTTSINGGLNFGPKIILSTNAPRSFNVSSTSDQNRVSFCWASQLGSDITSGTQIFSTSLQNF